MRSTEPMNIAGHLTAANLFGYQPQQLPEPEIREVKPSNVLTAVYPAIIEEAFAMTMDNYRQYVSKYNARTQEENELIKKHNALVQKYKKNNQLTDVERKYLEIFPLQHRRKRAREYNAEADAANAKMGRPIIAKRKIQKVKPVTEQIFQHILHIYNGQLMKRNEQYMRLAVRTPRPIQELKLSAYFITRLKRKEIASIDFCTKTIRNHRQRLEEAGVLTDYVFHGHTMGVELHINPEILAVTDLQTGKIAFAENQPLTPGQGKVLPDNNETTGTNKEEYKKRKDVAQSFDNKELPAATGSLHYRNVFYRNTGGKVKNSPVAAPPESVKAEKTLSEKLRDLIIHPQQLAIELADGEHFNYVPIDIRLLYTAAFEGTLTRSEYRELVIQDFFKTAAKLYRHSNAYAGSWKNAINHWMQVKWLTFNGYEFNKANIVDDIQQLRWRVEQARKWFANSELTPLYPSNYFDLSRRNLKEVGFEGTKRWWERHEKYEEGREARERKRQRNAKARLQRINHSKKFENEIRRFLRNKITLPQLFDYVERNLPAEYLTKLPETLNRLMAANT